MSNVDGLFLTKTELATGQIITAKLNLLTLYSAKVIIVPHGII